MALIDPDTGEVCCVECSAPLEIRTNSTKENAMQEETKITVPDWIDPEYITVKEIKDREEDAIANLRDIATHGCASGVYMPAVTYTPARDTMNDYGDAIFVYIEDSLGEIPVPPEDARASWSNMACYFVSLAVELWASSTLSDLEIEV